MQRILVYFQDHTIKPCVSMKIMKRCYAPEIPNGLHVIFQQQGFGLACVRQVTLCWFGSVFFSAAAGRMPWDAGLACGTCWDSDWQGFVVMFFPEGIKPQVWGIYRVIDLAMPCRSAQQKVRRGDCIIS